MNNNNQLPIPTSSDPMDRLLTDYFHRQLPKTWPDAPQPWATTQATSRSQRDTLTKSRFALAASVALLLGGCWYLSGNMTNGKKTNGINIDNGGSANTKVIKDLAKPKPEKMH